MKINDKQRIVILVTAVSVAVMLLFPPYVMNLHNFSRTDFEFIFGFHRGVLNSSALLTEWVGALIFGCLSFLYFEEDDKE